MKKNNTVKTASNKQPLKASEQNGAAEVKVKDGGDRTPKEGNTAEAFDKEKLPAQEKNLKKSEKKHKSKKCKVKQTKKTRRAEKKSVVGEKFGALSENQVRASENCDGTEIADSSVLTEATVYAVIMAGGAGTRFWPLSRAALPKQFIDLPECNFSAERSMLRQTADRMSACVAPENIFVAAGSQYESLAKECLPWLGSGNLVSEKQNLDTAFAIAGALRHLAEAAETKEQTPAAKAFGKSLVVFAPCDHYISDSEGFSRSLNTALRLAAKGSLVTIGITPDAPLTEYGYMTAGKKIKADGQAVYYRGKSFVEKPRKKKAEKLLKKSTVFWNSGIFIAQAELFVRLLSAVLPDAEIERELSLKEKINLIQKEMLCKNRRRSFDRLVMENLAENDFLIVPADFEWDDLGTFSSLGKYWRQEEGNSVHGCLTAAYKSRGNVIYREGGLVALVDVDDLLVAEADGVLLVMPKDSSSHLKRLVEHLEKQDLQEYL
ncbi:MAG: mannose-1-phosphate guanylyltransferase [Bacillota bacterium]|jgi:mannose-1-phosphate guanylyltransferase